ncbi:hypothetical protein FAI40_05565 [Acetobacteraceae bacterium]|nr:hypothetical protein FAI40_05565 [Acetobacteraceae bacterium]
MFGKRPTPEVEIDICFDGWSLKNPFSSERDFGESFQKFKGSVFIKNSGISKLKEPYISVNLIKSNCLHYAPFEEYASEFYTSSNGMMAPLPPDLKWIPNGRTVENWRISPEKAYDSVVHIVSQNPWESVVSGETLACTFGLEFVDEKVNVDAKEITLKIVVGADDLASIEYEICFDTVFLREFKKIRNELLDLKTTLSNRTEEMCNLKSKLSDLIASKNLKKN